MASNYPQKKTIAIHFHRKRGLPNEPTLRLDNQNIIFKDSAKFLGMTFDHKLNWNAHISLLKNKSLKSLNIIKCLSNTKWGSDRATLLRLYRAIVRSKLDWLPDLWLRQATHS